MDQQTAQVLFHEGATLIIQDMPEGSEFGIDYNSWNTGPNFKGLKMIPPGIHFVYYSSCNKLGDTAPRTGFFHCFKQKEIVVKKWDNHTEEIQNSVISDEELEKWDENKKELDKFLGPYPYEKECKFHCPTPFRPDNFGPGPCCHQPVFSYQIAEIGGKKYYYSYKKWISMSNQITKKLLDELQPESGIIASVTELLSEPSSSKSRKLEQPIKMEAPKSLKEAESRLPNMPVNSQTSIHFTEVPKCKYPPNSSPIDISKYSMDSSYVLLQLLSHRYENKENGILGEIQFAFICFHIGHVYHGFEQWKKLVNILCTCEESLSSHSQLFMDLIMVLHFQLEEIPEDFFVDIVSSNNFLTSTLHVFFSNLESSELQSKLKKRGLKFKDHLTEKFKWDFTEEPDEYAPVIV